MSSQPLPANRTMRNAAGEITAYVSRGFHLDETGRVDEDGPREQAMDRMEAARRGLQHARREAERIVREAEEEWEAADAELTRLEVSPGIPSRR